MDTYKLYGELLTANLYKFKASPNLDKIELENYYDNNNLITIPLDKSISVHKNIGNKSLLNKQNLLGRKIF